MIELCNAKLAENFNIKLNYIFVFIYKNISKNFAPAITKDMKIKKFPKEIKWKRKVSRTKMKSCAAEVYLISGFIRHIELQFLYDIVLSD